MKGVKKALAHGTYGAAGQHQAVVIMEKGGEPMAHRKKNRNVGIIGIGQTKYSSHREDVNQPEMIHEAVSAALADAGIGMKDIDCVVHGNMELFEMVHQPDLWHVLGTGAYGKDSIRITPAERSARPSDARRTTWSLPECTIS